MAWTFKWLWDSSPNHDKLFNELEWLQIISNVEINGNKKSFVSITIFCKSRSCWGNWDENLWKISLISRTFRFDKSFVRTQSQLNLDFHIELLEASEHQKLSALHESFLVQPISPKKRFFNDWRVNTFWQNDFADQSFKTFHSQFLVWKLPTYCRSRKTNYDCLFKKYYLKKVLFTVYQSSSISHRRNCFHTSQSCYLVKAPTSWFCFRESVEMRILTAFTMKKAFNFSRSAKLL